MRSENRALRPPFELASNAYKQWLSLQQELGGTIRGLGLSGHEVWRLALCAEHQADHFKNRLPDKLEWQMREIREHHGLPPYPP